MKKWFIIFSFVIVLMYLVSCKPGKAKSELIRSEISPTDTPEILIKPDSLSNQDNRGELPDWLHKLYSDDGESSVPHSLPTVTFARRLTDITSYRLYNAGEVNCLVTVLVTQKNGKDFMYRQVGRACDIDYAVPVYSGLDFVIDSNNNMVTRLQWKETAKQKYLVNGPDGVSFKEGYSMETAEKKEDSIVTIFKIISTGEIIETKATPDDWNRVAIDF